MQHNLPSRINADITFIDYVLQRERDRAAIERMLEEQQIALAWGQTLPACPTERIVDGTIEEVQGEQ